MSEVHTAAPMTQNNSGLDSFTSNNIVFLLRAVASHTGEAAAGSVLLATAITCRGQEGRKSVGCRLSAELIISWRTTVTRLPSQASPHPGAKLDGQF